VAPGIASLRAMARPEMSDRLVWMDLEMTGLDTARHTIVEIAVLITDSELELVDDGIDVIVHASPEQLAEMDDFVTKMHTKSGLLPAIEASTLSLEDAGKSVLAYLAEQLPGPGTAPLCGNSIGVDRRFLDRYLPEVDQYVHYRSVDVSSFKELCRRWYPAVYKHRPDKAETHRALDDIRESIEELRFYRANMLLPEEPADAGPTTPPEPEDGIAADGG
jgi:oligoribonuclease